MERINKYLARCGLGSRRQCEQLVSQGRVKINGKTTTQLATQVDSDTTVHVDGRPAIAKEHICIAFHKPKGVLCTADDPQGRPTIYDLLPGKMGQLHYVGRLDRESEGLLILTNDGSLTQELTHPSHEVEKEYLVTLDRAYDPKDWKRLTEEGIETPEGLSKLHSIEIVSPRRLLVTLKQGLKRQIRYTFAGLDYRVKKLVRLRIGSLSVEEIPPGRWRTLNSQEIEKLRTNHSNPTRAKARHDQQARRNARVKAKQDEKKTQRRHRPTRNSQLKNRKSGAKRWKRHK